MKASTICGSAGRRTFSRSTNTKGDDLRFAKPYVWVSLVGILYILWVNNFFPFTSLIEISGDLLSIQRFVPGNSHWNETLLPAADANHVGWSRANPLGIPQGRAKNLPSIRVEDGNHDGNVDKHRKFYGGTGDKAHLGGFTELDTMGVSPAIWRHMIEDFNIHSLIDVGCGRGISTSWFDDHGVDVMCVEGSHDAFKQSVLDDPGSKMVEHDFSRGPWWPEKTYDAAWSVEFLEHVGLNYHFNYIATFRKAAIIFATSSRWGGWHHVEVHQDEWWVLKFQLYGFHYSASLTQKVRQWAAEERDAQTVAPNGVNYNAQHIWLTMKVFINPAVAALPEHAHLFYEHGCSQGMGKPGRPCGVGNGPETKIESKMPPEFLPIKLSREMDKKWEDRIKNSLKGHKTVVGGMS